MELNSLATEVIVNHPQKSLGHLYLDWSPQPGAYIDVENQTYLVLERRHRYGLTAGRYQLYKIALYVQKIDSPLDRNWFDGRWMIGDRTCRFNARSELLRCAVHPAGPCEGCSHYQPLDVSQESMRTECESDRHSLPGG
ncbi:MAG: DUF6464 family protein [Elainellaceae cyanobacterium]